MYAVAHGLSHAACIQLHSIDDFFTSSCTYTNPAKQHATEVLRTLDMVVEEHADVRSGIAKMYDPVFGVSVASNLNSGPSLTMIYRSLR